MFGIGLPTLALQNLLGSIGNGVASQQIAERIEGYKDMPPIDLSQRLKAPLNLLSQSKPADQQDEIAPMLGYFSAREGFRRTGFSISAPLSSVSCAASKNWSLRSMTHEVSHGIVSEVFDEVFPFLWNGDDSELEELARIVVERNRIKTSDPIVTPEKRTTDTSNILQSLAADFADAAVCMRWCYEGVSEYERLDGRRLASCIEKSYVEMNEVLAHAVDILYFYQSDVERYVKSVWSAWGKTPNIQQKVKVYLSRTISAVYAARYGGMNERNTRLELFEETRDLLEELKGELADSAHIELALDILNSELEQTPTYEEYSTLYSIVNASSSLIEATWRYIYDENIAANLMKYVPVPASDKDFSQSRQKYVLKIEPAMKLAKLIMEYNYTDENDSMASACLFHRLAFCGGV
ncbi:MAG: hypothetical protein IJ087_04395 [Eggerthellaceae bacterium]|nr:hypothetical protein [Eggerthellaceae bacterium]